MLDFDDGRIRVKRYKEQHFLDCCIAEHDRYGKGSAMVWGAIQCNRKSRLIFIRQKLNSENYCVNVLEKECIPFVLENPGNIFMQDNAPCHRSIATLIT